jgi:iron(III) transport system permease protein
MSTAGRRRRAPAGLVVAALVTAVVFGAPLAYVVLRNLGADGALRETLAAGRVAGPLGRTLLLAVTVSLSAAVAGTAQAWLLTRSDVPGRGLWRVLGPVPLVVPSFLGAATFVSSFGRQGIITDLLGPLGVESLPRPEGFWGAWFVLTVFTTPYVLLPVMARLSSLSPSLEESARLLGRRPPAVFRTVVLPQVVPSITAGALLVFLYTVSEFGAVTVLRYDTLTTSIYASRLFDRPRSLALSLVLAVVALAVVVGERAVARRVPVVEAARARRPLQVSLGRWRWPAALGLALWFAATLGGPGATLVRWVRDGLGASGDRRLAIDWGQIGELAGTTAAVGLVAAVAAVAAVLPTAYLLARHRSRVASTVNAVVVGGFALPGIVIALALISWALSNDLLARLYQGYTLLIVAYVVHFGAQALRSSQVAVAAVPSRMIDAARVLGARRGRVLRTVEVPVMAPGLAAGGGLVLLSVMKELPVTLLLAPIGTDTLATHIWGTYNEALLGQAGVAALVLLATSAVLTWLVVLRPDAALRR